MLCLSSAAHASERCVIPSGECVGVKLYTDGLCVAGTAPVLTPDGKELTPADSGGVRKGDIIKSVNGVDVESTDMFSDLVNASSGALELGIERGNRALSLSVTPVKAESGGKKLGLWVRDSTAGIGTLTYFDPAANTFAALGHGICDVDTANILAPKSGNILHCSVLSVTKSERGNPGELDGSFELPEIADIVINSHCGIYGLVRDGQLPQAEPVRVADRDEVHVGDAQILTSALNGLVSAYSAEILKVDADSTDSKGLVVRVTDERVLNATGGIVRGMSGAPIMQDGLLVGAVTHVFVNDPAKGYGILAENMLAFSDLSKNSEELGVRNEE